VAEFELKRFWERVDVVGVADGFSVALDGRAIKTPLKRALVLPTEALAAEVAAEWRAVEGKVDFGKMPYTRFTHAALDQAVDERAEISAKIALYGETDLLCYRADNPQELIERQKQAWDPLLAWSAEELGSPLVATTGIVHVEQPRDSIRNLTDIVKGYSGFALTALYDWVTLSGSLVLALAVSRGRIGAAEAWALSRMDEDWQIEQWGVDDDAEALANSKRETFLLIERAVSMI